MERLKSRLLNIPDSFDVTNIQGSRRQGSKRAIFIWRGEKINRRVFSFLK